MSFFFFCVFWTYLSKQEVCVTEKHVFPPIREVQEQALQRILGNEAELVVHVNSQSGEAKRNAQLEYTVHNNIIIIIIASWSL